MAAGLTYCIYRDAILTFASQASPGTSGLGFYTELRSHASGATASARRGMHSFVIGLVICALSICLGFNTGGYSSRVLLTLPHTNILYFRCLNPVRDFGPRLVALMAGYGGYTFTSRNGWWFWGGWVAIISGSLTGACLYDVFIFIGGMSLINYAPRRRHRAKLKKESKWRKRLGIGKRKLPSLVDGIKNLED